MITIRWWIATVAISFLLVVGVSVGYLVEKTIHALPQRPEPSPMNVRSDNETSGQSRDPVMEAGARFMVRVTEYKQRLERNPEDMEALVFLGNANYDITRFDKASEYYERVLAIDPTNITVRTDLATSYYKTGQVDRALNEIQTVLQQSPDHETALFNLGIILLSDKTDRKGAIEAWEKLLKEHPDSARSQELRQTIEELRTQG
jgi:tetratricopeptide (TPR) repeat protein